MSEAIVPFLTPTRSLLRLSKLLNKQTDNKELLKATLKNIIRTIKIKQIIQKSTLAFPTFLNGFVRFTKMTNLKIKSAKFVEKLTVRRKTCHVIKFSRKT